MVTKQQQLEWLANKHEKWPASGSSVVMSGHGIGWFGGCYYITQEEWQQERDKMQKKQDDSLSKRGSCPPIGEQVELWFGGSFAYNCELICMRGRNYIVWNLDADRPDCADIMNSEFRPLRTEREKEIDEMVKAITDDRIAPLYVQSIAAKLYNAGYRKEKNK